VNPNADHLKPLAPALRQQLDQGLQLFKQTWTETLLAETLGQMAADHPLRYASAVEMTWIDLAKRWKQGQRAPLEEYLESYPELGSVHTVSVDLIRLEYKVRKANGDPAKIEEYWERFPTQYEEFKQRTLYADEMGRRDQRGDAEKARPVRAKALSPVAAAFGAPPPVVVVLGAPTPAGSAPALATAAASKSRARWPWLVGAPLLLLAAAFLGWMGYKGGFHDPKKFFADLRGNLTGSTSAQAGDQVQSLTVKLDVGAGEAVQEPIYLDLGLGFPLWLVAGGAPPPVPFGAVPQQSTASGQLPANSSTTFTFNLAGEAGQDVLATTPQLLAGVKVSDIRRVGFASLAQQDWELAGFEIRVNGQMIHSAKGLKVRPKQQKEEALKKLAALNQQGAPVDQELADLRELVQTGLASESEKARLKELEQQVSAAAAPEAKTRLERQIRGQSPWYVEAVPSASVKVAAAASPRNPFDLTPRAHAQAPAATAAPRTVRVTVLTAAHPNSDTSNYVFVTVGGHKYLIGGPQFPLTSANPQAFDLDLMAGPLAPSDLHGWGLGMLAPPERRGKGPDRWHPRRLQVEVDGKTVFDSEDSPTDRQTLDAIRLVPPCQLDLDGSVVKNPSHSRELFGWQAGKASGFDPATGTINPVPPGTLTQDGRKTGLDPNVIVPDTLPDPKTPVSPIKPLIPNELLNPKTPLDPNTPPVVKPPDLPVPPGSSANLNPNSGFPDENQLLLVVPGTSFIPGTPGALPPPLVPPPPQIILAGPIIIQIPSPNFGQLPGQLTPLIPGQLPGQVVPLASAPPSGAKPVGKPFQIDTVEFVELNRIGSGPFTIRVKWTTSGDDSGVDHYDVSLMGLEDDLSTLGLKQRNGLLLSLSIAGPGDPVLGSIPKGVNFADRFDIAGNGFLLDGVDPAWRFVLPMVTPMTKDGKPITGKLGQGPARSTARFQVAQVPGLQLVNLDPAPGGIVNIIDPDPKLPGPKVPNPKIITPFELADAVVAVGPIGTVSEVRMSLTFTLPAGADQRTIRFYTGFSGGAAPNNTTEYRVDAFANEEPSVPSVTSAFGAATTIALNDVSVAPPIKDPTLLTPTPMMPDNFIPLVGKQLFMHQVSVKIPKPVSDRIKSSAKPWTIELTITMRNLKVADARLPIVFDPTILNK
jgi:hypothetical protein